MRDGTVRVYVDALADIEAAFRLAVALIESSLDHAPAALAATDAGWVKAHDAEIARECRGARQQAWGSRIVSLIAAIFIGATAARWMKGRVNLGPLELAGFVLERVGVPHYTGAAVLFLGLVYLYGSFPALRNYVRLRRTHAWVPAMEPNPLWSLSMVPLALICLAWTYASEVTH